MRSTAGASSIVLGLVLAAIAGLVWVIGAGAAGTVVVEDWSGDPVGAHGIPHGWLGQNWGKPAYDFTIVDDAGVRALQMVSHDDRSTIVHDLHAVDLRETPVLEWKWKVLVLPPGGDARRRETTDQAAQVYVVWRRFPELLRSRIIGYAWDSSVPAGTILPSRKTRTVTYVILRSGPHDLGVWLTEQRDVREDYRRIFGEEPPEPDAISLSIDSNDTHSSAESVIGPIEFHER